MRREERAESREQGNRETQKPEENNTQETERRGVMRSDIKTETYFKTTVIQAEKKTHVQHCRNAAAAAAAAAFARLAKG